jgi:hypothetical protein
MGRGMPGQENEPRKVEDEGEKCTEPMREGEGTGVVHHDNQRTNTEQLAILKYNMTKGQG